MRRINYLAIALMFTTLFGCQKEEASLDVLRQEDKIFYATFDNEAETRTALDESNNVVWSAGDQISVFGGSTANNTYILNEGANTSYGTFVPNSFSASTESGKSISPLSANLAYYPYDDKVTVRQSEGSYIFTANFPVSQVFTESGTFGNGASPMVAVTSSVLDANLKFKNVGAIFRLQLKGEATITTVVFSAEADLAGDCQITASNSAVPTVNVTEGSNTIVLDCGEGVQLSNSEATNFIVAMLPVESITGGMTITIYDNEGKKMVYTHKADETITIERSKAYTTDEVTYSGDQNANTATSVQAALDAAINADIPTTIQLEPGVNYGTLYFRPGVNSTTVDISDAGGDAEGNEKYSKYENITIIGAPGATVDQFDFQAKWIVGISCGSYIDIKNLIVKDVSFSGETTPFKIDGGKGGWLGIDGLTIDGCTMNDADGADRFVFQQISGYKVLNDKSTTQPVMTTGVKNLTIKNCTITGAYQVIESRAMENLKIINNAFSGIKERDMLITSDATYHPDVTYTGAITITGNTSTAGEERFIRASLNNSNATVTISNNVITDYKGEDYDFIKVDGANGTITTENNTFAVSNNNNNYLQKLIINAKDGTVFQLNDGDYGVLNFTHTYNGKSVSAKNIRIQGVNGTKMSELVCPSGVINGWSVANIDFYDEGIDIRSGGEGFSVNNCSFTDANIYLSEGYNGITINECTFDSSTTGGVYLQNVEDVEITNCTFTNMLYNAIQLSGGGISGSVLIENNVINNCTSRAMRIVTKDGATLNISNNIMTDSDNANDNTEADRGQIIKITGNVTTGTFVNNTHDDKNIVFTNGIATESE